MSIVRDLKFKVMEQSRRKKLEHFYSLCPDGGPILDAGVSGQTQKEMPPSGNIFLRTFRYDSKYYTGLGVEDLSSLEQLYPGKKFVQYPGGEFPFKDNEFDWVFSNAVIEHVGDNNAQVYFVNEMIRVGKNVFFTTPYKYFPIESHTDVFFLHWNNNLFYSWCKKHKPWCTKDHLYLFSRKRLESILRQSNADSYQIYNNRFLGMTMTFTVLCSD